MGEAFRMRTCLPSTIGTSSQPRIFFCQRLTAMLTILLLLFTYLCNRWNGMTVRKSEDWKKICEQAMLLLTNSTGESSEVVVWCPTYTAFFLMHFPNQGSHTERCWLGRKNMKYLLLACIPQTCISGRTSHDVRVCLIITASFDRTSKTYVTISTSNPVKREQDHCQDIP